MCRVCDIFKETTDEPTVSLWSVFFVAHLLIFYSLIFKERRIGSMSITGARIV